MVELHSFRRGYEAKNIDRLVESVLWRDINICNEIGVPALTYSPCVDMDVPT